MATDQFDGENLTVGLVKAGAGPATEEAAKSEQAETPAADTEENDGTQSAPKGSGKKTAKKVGATKGAKKPTNGAVKKAAKKKL